MNNIKLTAIRLIANAYLYSKEKNKECHAYRFDSSFLTSREITTINQLNQLQEELNKLGWCFNIINFNDYLIQEKSWIGELLKLGFGRVQEHKDEEVICEYIQSLNDQITNRIFSALTLMMDSRQQCPKPTIGIINEEIANSYKFSAIRVYLSDSKDGIQTNTHKDIKIRTEELCTRIYGDYFDEHPIVFSGNIIRKHVSTIVETVESDLENMIKEKLI